MIACARKDAHQDRNIVSCGPNLHQDQYNNHFNGPRQLPGLWPPHALLIVAARLALPELGPPCALHRRRYRPCHLRQGPTYIKIGTLFR